jgi:hypothetical protein
MCDYCSEENSEDNLRGDDGIIFNTKQNKHYLYIEHFRNEITRIEVNFCPRCGNKL